MEVEWADPPPDRGKYEDFFEALREHPGRWALFPGSASGVRSGKYAGCEKGEFEAREVGFDTYIRYVGQS